jgi:hypothetical protein
VVVLFAVGCSPDPPESLTDSNGNLVNEQVATMHRGPAHCEWQSATFVYVDGRQYIADPKGIVGEGTAGYQPHATLPADATDTGYRSGKTRLYLAADKSAIFLVRGSTTERLPVVTPMIGCA